MQQLAVLGFGLLLIVVVSTAAPQDTYTTKWDGINLDEILANERLLNNYTKCLLGKGNCTPDGTDLKNILPEALETDCVKCTPTQRRGTDKVVRFLIKNKPNIWNQLSAKYDPSGLYRQRHPEVFV